MTRVSLVLLGPCKVARSYKYFRQFIDLEASLYTDPEYHLFLCEELYPTHFISFWSWSIGHTGTKLSLRLSSNIVDCYM